MPVTLSPSVLRVFLASLDTPSLFLPLRLADSGVRISPTRSADSSVSLLRPVRVLFLATAVSFSIASDCVYVSFIRLPLFFFSPSLTHSFSFFRCFRPTRAYKPRNSVEYARRCAFDTRHLVQCVGGEREEISRRSSFLRECLFSLSHARVYTRSLSLRTT